MHKQKIAKSPKMTKKRSKMTKKSPKMTKKGSKLTKKSPKMTKKGSKMTKKGSINKKKKIQRGRGENDVKAALEDVKVKQTAYDKSLKDLEPAVSKLFNNYKIAINKTNDAKSLLKDVLTDEGQNIIQLPQLTQIKEYTDYSNKYNLYKIALEALKNAEIKAQILKYGDEEYLTNSNLTPAEKTIYTKLKEKVSPTFAKQQQERAALMKK